jgi:hypothetical protein
MELLGCNAKVLFNEVYNHIIDIFSTRSNEVNYIICKNFHCIHSELLDIFYSYMQRSFKKNPVKFILITESVSFIPDNIIECCEVINIPRPSRTAYNTCLGKRLPSGLNLSELENIKNIKDDLELVDMYKTICEKIIFHIDSDNIAKWSEFRDNIYEIFTYNVDVHKCVWYILSHILCIYKELDNCKIMDNTYSFLKYFNNNYRPIYHLEWYFLFLKSEIMKYKNKN